jgi:ABC-2 type transport system ATP-binding protein
MSITAFEVKNLVEVYSEVTALKNVSFSIKEGELFALLGPNGAGKTTTIRIISGLTQPTSGELYIYGKNIFNNPIWAKSQIGLVPQTINLDLELTVEENLFIHGLLYRMPISLIKQRISELLELADLTSRRKTKIKELSGGLRRRVLIIRALMHFPKILLLDEPTVGLDPHIRRKIWHFIKNIQSQGTTILLTTHYMEEAEFLADRVAFIFSGQIIDIDKPQNLIQHLGNYALDVYFHNVTRTFFFKSKEEAEKELLKYSKNHFVSLRRVNLEDVFLNYMEKRK